MNGTFGHIGVLLGLLALWFATERYVRSIEVFGHDYEPVSDQRLRFPSGSGAALLTSLCSMTESQTQHPTYRLP